MKNFFIRIVAIALICAALPVAAGVRSITEEATAPADPEKRLNELDKLYRELPNVNNKKAITEYIKKRLPLLHSAQIDSSELATPGATSIVDTNSPTQKEEHVLSAYEKIYQESIQRAGNMDNTVNEDVELKGTFYRLKQQQAENNAQPVLNFPYVTVKLSDEREILAPADEHFPYVLTTIKIEPTGLLKVTEDFTFISNNESFPQGFFRILPKYNYSRNGEQRRTDISLVSVTVNGEEKPYKMTEIGNYIYIEPKEPLDLPTGIYRYRFNYVIDRAVWYYDNFDELFWDITAKTLKNVVGSANAVVYLPSNRSFIAQNAIVSTRRGIDAKRVTINALTPGALGFADTEALGVGEDIHLYLTMEKGTLLPPDFSKKYQWFIHDYGACFFALLALVAIFLSYKISLEQIRRNKDKTNIYLKKTPALYRLLNANVYDAKSFGAEILSLCAKNILGLQQNDGRIALIKKSDDLRHLSLTEKKLVKTLFPGQETTLPASPESALKLKRAYNALHYGILQKFHLYKLKLNAAYLSFSFAMLITGIACSSSLAIAPWDTFWIVLLFTVLMCPPLLLFLIRFKSNAVNIAVKSFCTFCELWLAGWMAIYTSNFYAVLILLSLYLIISYNRLFSRRSGLLRNKIKETEEYKSYLQKNIELTRTGRDFSVKVPYIYAFGLENKYKEEKSFMLIGAFLHLLPNKSAGGQNQ